MPADPTPDVNAAPAPAKSFLVSKTFWILLCGLLLAPLLKKLGVEFTDADQQRTADILVQLFTAAGALWARARAQGPLSFQTPGK